MGDGRESPICRLGVGTLTGTIATASLASKFKSLGIDNAEVDEFVQFLKPKQCVLAGVDVIQTGAAANRATLLLSGIACSYKRLEDGIRQIHTFHYPGDFCDFYRYVLPEQDEAITVQALTDCLVATIDYADIDQLLVRHPTLQLALWRATMLEAAILRERLSNARRGSALQRVANLLCEQLARREAIGITDPVVPIKQVDLADAAGLSIVHINRTIQTLRSLNVLSAARQAIEVVDRKQLAKLGGFDSPYLNMPKLVSKWAVQIDD